MSRLNEQGVPNRRIRLYIRRWIILGICAASGLIASTSVTYAALVTDPNVCVYGAGPTFNINAPEDSLGVTHESSVGILNQISDGSSYNGLDQGGYGFFIVDSLPNPELNGFPNSLPALTSAQSYVIYMNSDGDYCAYSFEYSAPGFNVGDRTNWQPIVVQIIQNVPIFGPLGLLTLFLGLIGIGRLTRKKS